MKLRFFELSIDQFVAQLAMNRPEKANALDQEAWIEMRDVFEYLSDNELVRVIVLSGTGKNFCSGIDISLLMDLANYHDIQCEARKREKLRKTIVHLQDCISAIERCQKPVLAAVQGACVGAGVDIVSCCDIRYCTTDAYFSIRELDMGLVADIGTMQRLPRLIPAGFMAEMAFTGRNVNSEEAYRTGLVNKIYTDISEMQGAVMEIARLIASKSPLVIRGTKENLIYSRDHKIEEGLRYVANYNSAFLLSSDLLESFRSHMTKTKPNYTD